MTRTTLTKKPVVLVFLLALPLWFKPLTWWLALSPSRSLGLLGAFALMLDSFLNMVMLAALLMLIATPFLLCFRRTRGWTLQYAFLSVVFLLFLIGGEWLGKLVWKEGYVQFVAQSDPLIQAVSAYESAHGHLPSALSELVPEFLPSVPSPRTGGSYLYYTGKEAKVYKDNPWVLRVPVPSHIMGFDEMLYFPRQNYPENGYGGSLERIGIWAYVHE